MTMGEFIVKYCEEDKIRDLSYLESLGFDDKYQYMPGILSLRHVNGIVSVGLSSFKPDGTDRKYSISFWRDEQTPMHQHITLPEVLVFDKEFMDKLIKGILNA